MANNWSDPYLRGVKRQISAFEKRSVPTTLGRAVVMPGEPPARETEIGEVEELRQAGFDPMYIFGVEREQALAVELYKYYYDTCHIHWEEVGEFLLSAQLPFSYIHLDFTSQLKQDELEAIQSWMGKVDRIARLRVSVVSTRRQDHQIEYEQMLRRTTIGNLCHQASVCEDGPGEGRFAKIWDSVASSTDTTQILTAVMLLNFLFGINAMTYGDLCVVGQEDGKNTLPRVRGTHRLTNITRFMYSEPTGHHQMFTLWCDLVPLQLATVPDEQSWVLNEMANVLGSVAGDLPQFIPELYVEAR